MKEYTLLLSKRKTNQNLHNLQQAEQVNCNLFMPQPHSCTALAGKQTREAFVRMGLVPCEFGIM